MTFAETSLASHVRYHAWAALEMWSVIRKMPPVDIQRQRGTAFGTMLGTLCHMYLVDGLWLARIQGRGELLLKDMNAPSEPDALEREWDQVLQQLIQEVQSLETGGENLSRTFTNSQGVGYEMPVWQILHQVVNHGTGHRGELKAMMRQSGVTPPNTDLVQFYRSHPVCS